MAQSEAVKSPDLDSEMEEMAELFPGFGGMFYDDKGRPNVYLTDSSSELRLKSINPDVVILQGEYDFKTLQSYRVELRSALTIDGVVALDVDERSNRVRISISQDLNPKGQSQLRRRLMRMSADPDAVIIDESPELPRHQTITVQNSIRPVLGDPPYDVQACPPGRRCQLSDSALADIINGTTAIRGQIAQTADCNTGTINDFIVVGSLPIIGAATAVVGQVVTKVGTTTGCRQGTVFQTCVDINLVGTNTILLCLTIVGANGFPIALPGDNGSLVFIQAGNNAIVVGIVSGGNGNGSLMIFDPIN